MAPHLAILIIDDDETSAAPLETYVASAGHAARRLAAATARSDYILSLQPDLLLVALTGENTETILTLCRAVSYNLLLCPIIMYGPAPDVDTMQLAMAAGVRRFITAPVAREELLRAIVETRAQAERNQAPTETRSPGGGTVMLPGGGAPTTPSLTRRSLSCAVFGPKGGVGASTLAVNMAVGLQMRGWSTVLVDADMSHSSAAVLLDITSTSSLLQLVLSGDVNEPDLVSSYLVEHQQSGLRVLLAPNEPEQSERVTADHLRSIIGVLQDQFEAVVVDAGGHYDDRTLLIFDMVDKIVVPATPDIAAARTLSSFLRISDLVGQDPAKVVLVLMRADSVRKPFIASIERYAGRPFDHQVVSDSVRATAALNSGTPLLLSSRSSKVSSDLLALVDQLTGTAPGAIPALPPRPADSGSEEPEATDGAAATEGRPRSSLAGVGQGVRTALRRPAALPITLAALLLLVVAAFALTSHPAKQGTAHPRPTATATVTVTPIVLATGLPGAVKHATPTAPPTPTPSAAPTQPPGGQPDPGASPGRFDEPHDLLVRTSLRIGRGSSYRSSATSPPWSRRAAA